MKTGTFKSDFILLFVAIIWGFAFHLIIIGRLSKRFNSCLQVCWSLNCIIKN